MYTKKKWTKKKEEGLFGVVWDHSSNHMEKKLKIECKKKTNWKVFGSAWLRAKFTAELGPTVSGRAAEAVVAGPVVAVGLDVAGAAGEALAFSAPRPPAPFAWSARYWQRPLTGTRQRISGARWSLELAWSLCPTLIRSCGGRI